MPDLLLAAAVLAAGLACPAVMWWQHRRGRAAPCCLSRASEAATLEALWKRQETVSLRIAELEDGGGVDRSTNSDESLNSARRLRRNSR